MLNQILVTLADLTMMEEFLREDVPLNIPYGQGAFISWEWNVRRIRMARLSTRIFSACWVYRLRLPKISSTRMHMSLPASYMYDLKLSFCNDRFVLKPNPGLICISSFLLNKFLHFQAVSLLLHLPPACHPEKVVVSMTIMVMHSPNTDHEGVMEEAGASSSPSLSSSARWGEPNLSSVCPHQGGWQSQTHPLFTPLINYTQAKGALWGRRL